MVKINKLEVENVKRVRAVTIEPTQNGLTVIGGKNNQGKTSVLDAIAWALGGDKFRPSQAHREGSTIPPLLHITLSNGLVVERRGKNSDLKVIDPEGKKAGQQLLNEFVEQLALDLPRFMESSDKEKADTLLQIIGVGDKLMELDRAEQEKYNERLAIGRIADQKEKFAKELPFHQDAPEEIIPVSELIKQQQDILAKNGENQRKRDLVAQLEQKSLVLMNRINEAVMELNNLQLQYDDVAADLKTAKRSAQDLQDESTAELEQSIANIDAVNAKVRDNLSKSNAEDEAKQYRAQYDTLTGEIESIRKQRTDLLNGAEMPLPGLSVEQGKLVYNGFNWDNMSGSEQLKVATAIVRKLNPKCGFVLLDKLEQMDIESLQEFGRWLEEQGLQAIATRVSTGEECSIIISDGYGIEPQASVTGAKQWQKGVF